jgi:hypothetical protein
MTEAEMKTKWCPWVRLIAAELNADGTADPKEGQAPFNRVALPGAEQMTPHASMCIGSACSQWRWVDAESVDVTAHGFCGVAGKP